MELNISRAELKTAVAGFSRIIPNKTTLPILGGARFTVDETGTLTCTATDLDQQATYRFQNATADGTGTTVLPLPSLKELTKGSDREQILFTTMPDKQVTVTNHVGSHQIRFTLNALSVEDWPAMNAIVPTKPAEGFLDVYRRLLPFTSTDETRYALTNVFIDVDGKTDHPVCMAATDGRRLSVWNSMAFDLKSSVLVPASRFLAWSGLTGKVEIGLREEVTPRRGKDPESRKQWFGVTVGPWCYVTRVPEVSFPNWRQVIPHYTNETVQCCCFTDQDAEALRKILPTFPGHSSNTGTIVLVGQNGRLSIAGRDDTAERETLLTLEGGSTYEGPGGQIGMNRSYLLDALTAGFRRFSYVDEMTPLKSEDGRGGTHVLMPVRTGREMPPSVKQVPVPEPNENAPVTTTGETKSKKETKMPEKNEESSALDKVLAAVETAKGKLRDAVSSLSEVTDAVKVAVKEGKTQAADLEKARATLQKLQAISL